MRSLRSTDVRTGSVRTLEEGPLDTAAADLVSGTLAFTLEVESNSHGNRQAPVGLHAVLSPPTQDRLEGGIYIIRRGHDQRARLDYSDWLFTQWQITWIPEVEQFVASGAEAVFFTPSGEIAGQISETEVPLASPDGSWLLFGTDRWGFPVDGLWLYASDGSFTASIDNDLVWHPRWSPNSSAVFYLVKRDQSWEWVEATIPQLEKTVIGREQDSSAVMRLAAPAQ